jgi:glycosyltransferase involved in cell wall biosynthesis
VICFGANETRSPVKGFGYLKTALERLSQLLLTDPSCGTASSEVLLLCAGGDFRHITRDLPFEVRYLGHVKDTVTMALMFQASDVFACPSVYDAGPVMIPESMMCGTPVVAFKAGGAADLLSNMETGYMAEYMNADDFAHGLYSILTGKDALRIRSNAGKAAAERNSSGAVLKRYLDLLGSLTDVVPGAGAPSLPRIARS